MKSKWKNRKYSIWGSQVGRLIISGDHIISIYGILLTLLPADSNSWICSPFIPCKAKWPYIKVPESLETHSTWRFICRRTHTLCLQAFILLYRWLAVHAHYAQTCITRNMGKTEFKSLGQIGTYNSRTTKLSKMLSKNQTNALRNQLSIWLVIFYKHLYCM